MCVENIFQRISKQEQEEEVEAKWLNMNFICSGQPNFIWKENATHLCGITFWSWNTNNIQKLKVHKKECGI